MHRHSGNRYSQDRAHPDQHRSGAFYGRSDNGDSQLYSRDDRRDTGRYDGYSGPPHSYYNSRRQNYEEDYQYEMDDYSNGAAPYRREYTEREPHQRKSWMAGQSSDHHNRSPLLPAIRDRVVNAFKAIEDSNLSPELRSSRINDRQRDQRSNSHYDDSKYSGSRGPPPRREFSYSRNYEEHEGGYMPHHGSMRDDRRDSQPSRTTPRGQCAQGSQYNPRNNYQCEESRDNGYYNNEERGPPSL